MRLREAARWQLTQNCFRQLTESIQLFRERLSEKVHATIPKGIVVGGFEFMFFKEILKEWHERGHGRMFASAKGKQQK